MICDKFSFIVLLNVNGFPEKAVGNANDSWETIFCPHSLILFVKLKLAINNITNQVLRRKIPRGKESWIFCFIPFR